MALQKTITTKFGYDANYLFVHKAELLKGGTTSVIQGSVALYKDAAQKQLAVDSYIDAASFQFTVQNADLVGDILALPYLLLKANGIISFSNSGEVDLSTSLDV